MEETFTIKQPMDEEMASPGRSVLEAEEALQKLKEKKR